MNTSKGRISMRQIYEDVADALTGDDSPTHTTVRCYCNDVMEGYERDGFTVNHRYSQDTAFREVCKLLGVEARP